MYCRESLVIAAVVLCVTPASAVDGVLEINQACAAGPGCFAGDGAGFPVTITSAGSYRLTSDLTLTAPGSGIEVAANHVSIDLNGFGLVGPTTCTGSGASISCGSQSGRGIRNTNFGGRDVWVSNGRIRGFGFGIELGDASRVESVTVETNGSWGIVVGAESIVSDATAHRNGNFGIQVGSNSLVRASRTTANGSDGVSVGGLRRGVSIQETTASENGGDGIDAGNAASVRRCTANDNEGTGIRVGNVSLVTDSIAWINSDDGIEVTSLGSSVQRNVVNNNSGVGLNLLPDTNYRENTLIQDEVSSGFNTGANVCEGTVLCP